MVCGSGCKLSGCYSGFQLTDDDKLRWLEDASSFLCEKEATTTVIKSRSFCLITASRGWSKHTLGIWRIYDLLDTDALQKKIR